MLGVGRFPPDERLVKRLQGLGWESLGEAGVPARFYFRMRGMRSAHLHVVLRDGEHWVNILAFREYLRNTPDARRRYADAKRLAVSHGASSLARYSAEKADLLRTLINEALAAQQAVESR